MLKRQQHIFLLWMTLNLFITGLTSKDTQPVKISGKNSINANVSDKARSDKSINGSASDVERRKETNADERVVKSTSQPCGNQTDSPTLKVGFSTSLIENGKLFFVYLNQ